MALRKKTVGYVLSLILMSSMLNGCVAIALAPTALSLAAEGFSVHTTGQTITENLKSAILGSDEEGTDAETVEMASRNHPGLPPRKPEPPVQKAQALVITGPVGTIGNF